MLSALIIVFREILEMSLIICLLFAATKGLKNRSRWIISGIIIGSISALAFASLAGIIAQSLSPELMKIFRIFVLFIAAGLIAYTVIWMQTRAKTISMELKNVGESIKLGQRSIMIIMGIVALAVLREGIEIILFLYGIFASENISPLSLLIGSFLGASLGIIVGIILYLGLVRIPIKKMFNYTSFLLSIIAAGLVAKGVAKLIGIGWLPGIINQVWDTSFLIDDKTMVGKFFAVLIGYQSKPTLLALLVYGLVLVLIYVSYKTVAKKHAFKKA